MKIEAFGFKMLLFSLSILLLLLISCNMQAHKIEDETEKISQSALRTTDDDGATKQFTEATIIPTSSSLTASVIPSLTASATQEPGLFIVDGGSLAVWWWDAGKAVNMEDRKIYLNFLSHNSVNQIYFCPGNYSDAAVADFVKEAGSYGMKCFWLTGDASWLLTGNKGEEIALKRFLEYQDKAADDEKFVGMHFDIEPHQNADFSEKRTEYMNNFAADAAYLTSELNKHGYTAEYDIAFWFDNDTVVYDGESLPFLDCLTKNADTVCLMSYRDNAQSVMALSSEEIAYGKKNGCKIVCGVETHSEEGDDVSFMEEGKRYMYSQLAILSALMKKTGLDEYGIAIHYLDTWYSLET